ncbi:hypothetical protein [Burkholderia gladioli]|uniref:hypothetical protein n=1 Tax=Burkholderia gladioli TaxID=28095 RepID=UPI00163FA0EE|nr:hypothetical protein [Burkholderia gladioli]
MATIIERLTDIRDLVADDVHADSFQSIREYRKRLILVINITIAEALIAAPADARVRQLEQSLDEVMIERDEYEGTANKLAAAIAKHLDVDIGEHSNLNCPWSEALDAIENAPHVAPAEAREPVGRFDKELNQIRWRDGVVNADFADRQPFYTYPVSVPADAGEAALTNAARDVLSERARQVSVEGWTPEHDDQYTKGELALAASQYVLHVACPFQGGKVPAFWPWPAEWWKPTTPRRDLVKAAALAIAEIERIDRAQGAQGGKGGEA